MDKERCLINNKSGQGLSTNAIILIILGVVVLVVLIVGFTIGWSQLNDKIFKSNNVDTVVNACNTACVAGSKYDFCSSKRELKAEDETLKDVTCYYLSMKKPVYGVDVCNLGCDSILVDLTGQEVLVDKCVGNEGKTVQTLIDNKLESYNCPAISP